MSNVRFRAERGRGGAAGVAAGSGGAAGVGVVGQGGAGVGVAGGDSVITAGTGGRVLVGRASDGVLPWSLTFENRVRDMADTETTSMNPAQAALVTEIEKTRADLARTIDAISDRVSPSRVAQRTSAQIKERLSQIDPLVAVPVALAVVSVTSYLVWRRLRK